MSGKRLVNLALKNIRLEMEREHASAVSDYQARGSKGPNFATGLSEEGYVGGYRDALNDVLLAMNGVKPSTRGWWDAK